MSEPLPEGWERTHNSQGEAFHSPGDPERTFFVQWWSAHHNGLYLEGYDWAKIVPLEVLSAVLTVAGYRIEKKEEAVLQRSIFMPTPGESSRCLHCHLQDFEHPYAEQTPLYCPPPAEPFARLSRQSEPSCSHCQLSMRLHEWRCRSCERLLCLDGCGLPVRLCHGSAKLHCPERFEARLLSVRTQLEQRVGRAVAAERNDQEPLSLGHLSFLLVEAMTWHEAGATARAEGLVGFVRGAVAVQQGLRAADIGRLV